MLGSGNAAYAPSTPSAQAPDINLNLLRRDSSSPEHNDSEIVLRQSATGVMPPPTPTSPSPRKRRRKREDPQSCLTNSEVSFGGFWKFFGKF